VLERELDLVRLGSGKKKNDASPRLDPPTCSSSNPAGPHARARAAQLPFLVAVPKLFFFFLHGEKISRLRQCSGLEVDTRQRTSVNSFKKQKWRFQKKKRNRNGGVRRYNLVSRDPVVGLFFFLKGSRPAVGVILTRKKSKSDISARWSRG
jgi:hypothetical protein